jgi:hypothetical protein
MVTAIGGKPPGAPIADRVIAAGFVSNASICDQSPTRNTQMTPQNAILSTPTPVRKATSRRKSNKTYCTREHLTESASTIRETMIQ